VLLAMVIHFCCCSWSSHSGNSAGTAQQRWRADAEERWPSGQARPPSAWPYGRSESGHGAADISLASGRTDQGIGKRRPMRRGAIRAHDPRRAGRCGAGYAIYRGVHRNRGFVLWRAAHGHGEAGDVILAVVGAGRSSRPSCGRSRAWRAGEALARGRTSSMAAGVRLGDRSNRPNATGANRSDGLRARLVSLSGGEVGFCGISIHIPAGAVVALVGENGTGRARSST